ncbi:MAG: hypothetical protein HY897_03840 [Deltaproteobacteria bacterium]|nr:hypothetical protein [Deltaproteobacteria bacterium]
MDTTVLTWNLAQFLGPALVEFSYIPQLARLYRMKHSHEISVWLPAFNLTGRAVNVALTWYAGLPFFSLAVACGFVLRAAFFGQVIYYRWKVVRLTQQRDVEIAI